MHPEQSIDGWARFPTRPWPNELQFPCQDYKPKRRFAFAPVSSLPSVAPCKTELSRLRASASLEDKPVWAGDHCRSVLVVALLRVSSLRGALRTNFSFSFLLTLNPVW